MFDALSATMTLLKSWPPRRRGLTAACPVATRGPSRTCVRRAIAGERLSSDRPLVVGADADSFLLEDGFRPNAQ